MVVFVFFSILNLYAENCNNAFTNWALPEETVQYITKTSINHYLFEERNRKHSTTCDPSEFVYGQVPEKQHSFIKLRRKLNPGELDKQISNFLRKCLFSNKFKKTSTQKSCLDKKLTYLAFLDAQNKLFCKLDEKEEALIIRIGSDVEYRFKYKKNDSQTAGPLNRSLEQNIEINAPSVYIRNDTMRACKRNKYKINFCKDSDRPSLNAGSESLLCSFKYSGKRFCAYGKGPSNLRPASEKTCPLYLNGTDTPTQMYLPQPPKGEASKTPLIN